MSKISTLNVNGLRMGLESMARLIKILEVREQEAVAAFDRAEQDINTYRQMLAFVKMQQTDFREQLARLEQT